MANICIINFTSEDIEQLRFICPSEVNLLSAKDTQDVFSLISQNQIDACVIDLHSSNIQPFEVVKQIKSKNGTYPVFAYTTECDPKVLFRAGQLGIDAYFKKPEEVKKLAEAIANLLKTAPNLISQLISKNCDHNCPRFIRLAVDYAQKNFAKMRRASEICEISKVSYAHFSRAFKSWTGYRFWNYVIHLKIQEAKRLLESTRLYEKEICYRVGFEDYPHFLKVFKNYEGLTPKNYRKRKGNQTVGSSNFKSLEPNPEPSDSLI